MAHSKKQQASRKGSSALLTVEGSRRPTAALSAFG